MSQTAPNPMIAPRRRRWRAIILSVLLTMIALACLTGGWMYWRWSSRPDYWRQYEAFLAAQGEALGPMADGVENRVLSELSQIGRNSSDTATVIVTLEEANAWLSRKLPAWAANQGLEVPELLRGAMVAIQGGRPVLAFAVKTPQMNQVFSIVFDIRADAEQARVQAQQIYAGTLPIPAGSIIELLKKTTPPEDIEPLVALFDGLPFDPVFRHPGHEAKKLRLIGFAVKDKELGLTLRAETR